jgi:DNA polymerase-3 subunit epsilon
MMTGSPAISSRTAAILKSRELLLLNPIYLDTETTGLKSSDEIIEISIVNDAGEVIYESLIRPTQLISPEAMAVHGISNQEVQNAPPWYVIWPTLRTHLFGREIGIYNAEFDLRMMQQSHARHHLPWKENLKSFDIMQLYARYKGEWDSFRKSYRYQSLDKAGKECKINIPNAHRAATDSLLARALLHFMADSDPG